MRTWNLCYHSTRYPVTTFVHMDVGDESQRENNASVRSIRQNDDNTSFEEPNANSTLLDPVLECQRTSSIRNDTSRSPHSGVSQHSVWRQQSVVPEFCDEDYSVGHMSHIPRRPLNPTTYTIPTVISNSVVQENHDDIFGMIKLKHNDVCYTSGSIEWVGRKRSYPINSGFKIINDSFRQGNEPSHKRGKRLDKTFTAGTHKIKECDCADVLPTVNAIVDHLNMLHEAVDLVDLRLTSLEDVDH